MGARIEALRGVEQKILVLEAELKPDKTFLHSGTAMVYRLWGHEIQREGGIQGKLEMHDRRLRDDSHGFMRIMTVKPANPNDTRHIQALRGIFRDGVMEWLKDGKPYDTSQSIETFYQRYIQPRTKK